jgi:Skp family chaperone for outer membrane proteins
MASSSASASASTSSAPTTITPSTSTSATTTPSTTTTTTTSPPETTRAQTEARAAVLATLSSAGASHASNLQTRAADLHANSAAIDKQQKDLAQARKGLAGETAKLEKEVDKALKGMRDFGDVQNWAEMLERDFMVLEETMRLVEGKGEVERESGGSTWK